MTVRAVRLDGPIQVDGRLDDPVYGRVAPLTDFIQQEPQEGRPATEKTDAWILFDDSHLYISARCWDSQPERGIANELRRDNGNILGNDNVTFVIDTFHDRRNGYLFQTNPLGALRDMTVTDDLQNSAWNGIWTVKTARFEQGWTMEVAIPFKTLRYRGSGPQTWGINLRRLVKWKNEFSYLSLVPAALGTGGVSRMASAATMVDLETPAESKNVEVKPYAMASATTARSPRGLDDDADANAGFDFKYGLTRGLILDATVRTDFAQVEEDLQQINLTRFSLFFPEKREFFIEGQGIFDFGGVQAGNSPGDVPLLFFSRQIGLSDGQAVPVLGGARLTGRAGPFSIGALDIQTDDAPAARAVSTNFSALRLKRNLLRRSNVGMIATRRGPGIEGVAAGRHDASYSVGADATLLFLKSINFTGYYAMTSGPDGLARTVAGTSYRGRFDYTDDRYGAAAEHMLIDGDFRPEVGFVRRTDVRRSFGQLRFSPRPQRSAVVRKLTWQGSLDYVTDAAATTVQSREAAGLFRVDFQSSDQASAEVHARVRTPARSVHHRARGRGTGRWLHRHDRPCQLHARPAASRIGTTVGGGRHALRRHQVRVHLQRPVGRGTALLDRAGRDPQLGAAPVRRLHRPPGQRPLHRDAERADADQQPGSGQRRPADDDLEPPPPLGVHRRQRAVRRLQRRPRHRRARVPRARQSHTGDQGDTPLQVLRRAVPYGTVRACDTVALVPHGPTA